jgi:hypothetical protein
VTVVERFVGALNLNVHFGEALRAGTPAAHLLCYHGVLALHAGLGADRAACVGGR